MLNASHDNPKVQCPSDAGPRVLHRHTPIYTLTLSSNCTHLYKKPNNTMYARDLDTQWTLKTKTVLESGTTPICQTKTALQSEQNIWQSKYSLFTAHWHTCTHACTYTHTHAQTHTHKDRQINWDTERDKESCMYDCEWCVCVCVSVCVCVCVHACLWVSGVCLCVHTVMPEPCVYACLWVSGVCVCVYTQLCLNHACMPVCGWVCTHSYVQTLVDVYIMC